MKIRTAALSAAVGIATGLGIVIVSLCGVVMTTLRYVVIKPLRKVFAVLDEALDRFAEKAEEITNRFIRAWHN